MDRNHLQSASCSPPAVKTFFHDNRKKLVLFGGLGGPPFNDTWEYDPAPKAWTQVTPGGDTPAPRYRVEAAFASDLQIAFFFGGQTTDFSNDLVRLGARPPVGPMIAAEGIRDVFSGEGGPFAPGELVSSYGVSLGPRAGVPSAFDPVKGTVPTVSAGVSVLIIGVPAPIYYVRADQVNAQIPYELEGQQEASITANYNGVASAAESVQIAAIAPKPYPGVFNHLTHP